MAPGAVRDNTQHARHAAAAPTDWRAHPRGRRATNWTHFVVERTQILTSRAGVVLRAAGSGDGVARLLARGHGSGGGGIGGDGVCAGLDAEALLRALVLHASYPTAGSDVVPRRPRRRRRARLSAGESQSFKWCSPTRTGRVRVLWRVTALARPARRLLASSVFRATPTKLALQPSAVCGVLVGAPSWC